MLHFMNLLHDTYKTNTFHPLSNAPITDLAHCV